MRKWIGLTGKMGAGKDHAFKEMIKLGANVVRISFADTLRHEIMNELGICEFPDKPYTEAVRRVLQWWGTDFRRAQDPDYWVKQTERRTEGFLSYTPVFTDVRFPNEAHMIERHRGYIIRVIAPDEHRRRRLGLDELPDHKSETAMDTYNTTGILYSGDNIPARVYEQQLREILDMAGIEVRQ